MDKRASSGFRKIDIDQYGDNVFSDEINSLEPPSPTDEKEIKRLLDSGKRIEAVRCLLSSSPFNQVNRDLMLQLLLSVKSSEMDRVIEGLEPELIDRLMKYIYRGFETPSEGSSGHLLIWHDKVFAVGGVGSVVRVITDKKRAKGAE